MRRPELLADLAEGEQTGVGIGHLGEPLEHHRQQLLLDRRSAAHPVREDLEVPQRPGRVPITQCTQPLRAASGVSEASSGLSRATAESRGR